MHVAIFVIAPRLPFSSSQTSFLNVKLCAINHSNGVSENLKALIARFSKKVWHISYADLTKVLPEKDKHVFFIQQWLVFEDV